MIFALVNDKGGVGKTTTAANLGVMRSLAGYRTAVVDCDKQNTLSNWCVLRAHLNPGAQFLVRHQLTGSDVAEQLLSMVSPPNEDLDVIVDTHGADSVEMRQAMSVADKVVMPLQMSQFDLWGVSRVLEVAKRIEATWPPGSKMDIAAMINGAHPSSVADKKKMREALEAEGLKVLDTVMHWRTIYQKMSSTGLAVVEMKNQDARGAATKEILGLYREVFGEEWRIKE